MCGRYVTPEVGEAERNLMVHWLEYERRLERGADRPSNDNSTLIESVV